MSVAVVYYSAHGNSALAAKALAEKFGAKLVELRETKTRELGKVNFAFMVAGMQGMFGVRSRLQGQPWKDAQGCAELHLITPVWAGKSVPAMNTFVSKVDFNGKTVSIYTVQADPSDSAKPGREALAKRLEAKGAKIAGTHGLTGAGPGKEPNAALAEKICSL